MENFRDDLSNSTLIFLHGVSSSGKSLIGKELSNRIPNSVWIDQDTFYHKEKPLITFNSTGSIFSGEDVVYFTEENWDSEESIDFKSFRNTIKSYLITRKYVIVTGFALREDLMKMKADYSFLLKFDADPNKIIDLITTFRSETKKFKTTEKQGKDYWMVRRVVWPFYLQTLQKIQSSQTVCVYDDKGRINKDVIINKIINEIGV